MRILLATALALASLFCLYAVIHFYTIADISTKEQLPRVHYSRNIWLVLFLFACAAFAAVIRFRPRPK